MKNSLLFTPILTIDLLKLTGIKAEKQTANVLPRYSTQLDLKATRWSLILFLLQGKATSVSQQLFSNVAWTKPLNQPMRTWQCRKKTTTNQNRYVRNEDRWHSFLFRRVREVFVEVITRINSELWECGTHRACAECRRQRALRKYDLLSTSISEWGRKSAHSDRQLAGLHATGVLLYDIVFLASGNWIRGSAYATVLWAGKWVAFSQ